MDRLGIRFSDIFLEKHGEKVFNDIINQIKSEITFNCNSEYIDNIFNIAFLTYFGVSNKKIEYAMTNISDNSNISLNQLQKVHSMSISTIQDYIKQINENFLNNLK